MAPVGVAFMAYALYQFTWRTRAISTRAQDVRYDDQFGPAALTVCLMGAVMAGYILIVSNYDWAGGFV